MEKIIGNEMTVQGERLSYEIKLVLVNGRVTLNGKTWSELTIHERQIFEILIVQEKEAITEILQNE
jgi:ribosomal protein L20